MIEKQMRLYRQTETGGAEFLEYFSIYIPRVDGICTNNFEIRYKDKTRNNVSDFKKLPFADPTLYDVKLSGLRSIFAAPGTNATASATPTKNKYFVYDGVLYNSAHITRAVEHILDENINLQNSEVVTYLWRVKYPDLNLKQIHIRVASAVISNVGCYPYIRELLSDPKLFEEYLISEYML